MARAPGEHELSQLLSSMEPTLVDGVFVFTTFAYGDETAAAIAAMRSGATPPPTATTVPSIASDGTPGEIDDDPQTKQRMTSSNTLTNSSSKLCHVRDDAIMIFREREGTTAIISREKAERLDLDYQFPCRMITLTIHSSLDAVGFLAAITTHLASSGIPTNAVSAFFHDHLFVPVEYAFDTLSALQTLAQAHSQV
eukprot:m.90332 g.90332  ORF g.90332 m.90332 type:complete len:196 (-) comp12914_c1_seq7:969-1556(-)